MTDEQTYTITYKGSTLTYTWFYELCDFIMYEEDMDWEEDENEIVRIAQRVDARAHREAIAKSEHPSAK